MDKSPGSGIASRAQPQETIMFKYILVPATGGSTDAPVFATALNVARRFTAHLLFLHVRVDVRDVAAAMVAGDIGGAVGIGEIMDGMEQDADLREPSDIWSLGGMAERNRP
jgi:hypothetical protein